MIISMKNSLLLLGRSTCQIRQEDSFLLELFLFFLTKKEEQKYTRVCIRV